MSDKIRPDHLERAAYVYVRQSSLQQVRHHREGQQRQYGLADRARHLGFVRVVVIDDDLGTSGSGKHVRPGFGRLLTAVCEGTVGAVFALEASRLARNNRDWHHLIDLCGMTQTVLVDDDGIYDPRLINDRLLLGLKGTMSEFELSLFRQRARAAFEQKVRRGCVMWEVPVGFVRTTDDRVDKSPDRQIQAAIQSVFQKFRELGSARQTLLYFRDEQIRMPEVVRGTSGHEVVWRLPTQSRIHQMLRNPSYAGAFAYGRTGMTTTVADGRSHTTRRRKSPEAWTVFLQDHHDGYITWDEYRHTQRMLEANVSRREAPQSGSARRGTALLSGLLRCGRCGRRLFVAYSGTGGRVPRYACHGGRVDRGTAACLTLGSLRVDRAVVEQVLDAIQPAGIDAALTARDEALHDDATTRQAVELALEKARYEARRAQRQFDAVDPENRLVASELEQRWNHALTQVTDIEARLQTLRETPEPVSEAQRARLVELGADLRLLWQHADASMDVKKRILRTVLEDIVVTTSDDAPQHLLHLHWKGGVHTELRVTRNGTGHHRRVTDDTAVELITELSKICDDKSIAVVLNRLGYRTGQGKTWRVHHVQNVRWSRHLPNFHHDGTWVPLEAAARELGVSNTVIKHLIADGVLPATQVVSCAPWVIARVDLQRPPVQARIHAVHDGRKLPRPIRGQDELPLQ
ncbi:MAG TPA: recombinase family protein [Vicinamibacterales bacterium]|nr:recombinase family protein [Vicinamibacterales bacterium]